MSYPAKVIVFGALAASLSLGAMQFAAGQDLRGRFVAAVSDPADTPAVNTVNRAAKADRAAVGRRGDAATQTISVRLSEFAATSFLLRVPVSPDTGAATAGDTRIAPSQLLIQTDGSKEAKRQVACEPTVSVLTEIAKRLQPGRCVT